MSGALEIIGLAAVIALGAAFVAAAAGAIFLKRERARGRVRYPRLTMHLIGLLYYPARALLKKFGRPVEKTERAAIRLMNAASEKAFSRAPLERRLLMLPHCLRHIECPASAGYAEGIACRECGLCAVAEIVKTCRERGIKCHVAMGSQFALRLLREQKPQAVMGVACSNDLFRTMYEVNRRGIPMVGELLSKDGCVMTEVDAGALWRRLLAGAEAGA